MFEKTTRFLLEGALLGFRATVFAYGATGAGKTFTMVGEAEVPGLMLMTFLELFSRIEELSYERKFKVRMSYLEIYNEQIRDLLHNSQDVLEIREDRKHGVTVSGLS